MNLRRTANPAHLSEPLSQLIRTIDVPAPPSERLLRACAAFGLGVRYTPNTPCAADPNRASLARSIEARIVSGQLALLTGPSGGGKSTLLTHLASLARANSHTVIDGPPSHPHADTPIIDLIDGPLAHALSTLARAGLADATLLGRSAYQLSDGERFRLRLAQCIASAACHPQSPGAQPTPRPITILIDEFASTLDRTTARSLCHALRRWLARASLDGHAIRIILATAHDDVNAWLAPDLTIALPLGRGVPIVSTPATAHTPEVAS